MGLLKFRKNILNATHNLEFSAVLVFPDSSITLDTRMSVPTMLVLIKDDFLDFQELRGVFCNFVGQRVSPAEA